MPDALRAVEEALLDYSTKNAKLIPRSRIEGPRGTYRLMAASLPSKRVIGSKQGFWASRHIGDNKPAMSSEVVSLYDIDTGELIALINSHYLNQVRTGAAGGVAAKYLSNEDSTVVAMIGAGVHAHTQLLAVCSVRRIERVRVYSRHKERSEEFCSEMSSQINVDFEPCSSSEEAVKRADIVIEATTSSVPVFDGKSLKEGAHVTSISGGLHGTRQLDDETIRRATLVSIDSKDQAALDGTGDILEPIKDGLIGWDNVYELADIVANKKKGRLSERDNTVFKSVGTALYDIAVGKLVVELAST
ncbi:MAG: ornithine cyclodeaminase family protein [Thaumarchaeota archaeon]|nr:ornithine cyclodeaminase family protein [Nitrososphaerota archaeon]